MLLELGIDALKPNLSQEARMSRKRICSDTVFIQQVCRI